MRKENHAPTNVVLFRDFWGKEKQSELLAAAIENQPSYEEIEPIDPLGLPFTPMQSKGDYEHWPALPDLFPVSFPGVQTSRDDVVIDINRERLISRMKKYFDPDITNEQMRLIAPGVMENTARFDAMKVREYLLKRGFLPENIVPFVYRPFDLRWLYWEPETELLDRKRAEYFPQIFEENIWLAAVSQNRKEFNPPLVSSYLCSRHVIERGANLFPLWLRPLERRETLDFEPSVNQSEAKKPKLNLSPRAIEYLSAIGTLNDAEALFYHVIAVLHAPAYACEHSGALRQNWPHIPLPVERDALLASAAIGQQIATLLNTEMEIQGITVGKLLQELRLIAKIRRMDSGTLGQDTADLQVNASWGYRNKDGSVMPGRGRVENRNYTSEELAGMELESNNAAEAFTQLGHTTYDVYLNENVIWQNVPSGVWHYTIGGYQVIKKWLSFREHKVMGRALSLDELQEVAKIARRITALLLLRTTLDTNYLNIKSSSAIEY